MPATTTASTPELCRLSASRYTPNGTTSPSALSTCGSSSLRRMRCTTQPTTNPTATPPTAASTNIPTPPSTVAPVPAATATNTRNSVSAVASLPRLSPLRMVIMRRGSPSRLPTVSAETASGGATIAPSTNPAGSVRPGTTHQATKPTTTVVNATSPTASSPIGRRFARMPA